MSKFVLLPVRRPALFSALIFILCTIFGTTTFAQDNSKKIHLFKEDISREKKAVEQNRRGILTSDQPGKKDFDVQAPNIRFDKDSQRIVAEGGMIISGKGVQAEADTGSVNTETKDAHLEGNVSFTGLDAQMEAKKADVNLEDETGNFEDASFLYEDGGYRIQGKKIFKLSETRYKLFDSKFTTCNCMDGLCPWSIDSEEARIDREGYAHTYNTTLWFHGVPVFYSPYLVFPAKLERASGLLAPTLGYSSKDGFQYKQPVFLALDDSTDLTVSPFTEVKTRTGSIFDVKHLFSQNNEMEGRLLYSNESARDGNLRGTRVEDLADPTIDTNRVGVYYNQLWRAGADEFLPYRLIADIHRVSDGTMVKELGDGSIVDPTSRVATSTVLGRSTFGNYLSGEVLGEWNQDIVRSGDNNTGFNDQKLTFDKLPEASLSFLRSYRPIENPYGLRLVTRSTLTEDLFNRDVGYDGSRTTLHPSGTIPFHISNYVSGSMGAGAYLKAYSLSNDVDPKTGELLDETQASKVPYLTGSVGTAFERVYELPQDSTLAYVTGLGTQGQDDKLVRIKHVVEPLVRYTFVPDITQSDTPQFDALDNIRERSLLTYGVSSSLLGRFSPRKDIATGVPELTPELKDLPLFDTMKGADISLRNGEIRELMDLSIKQSYDIRKEHRREDQLAAGQDPTILPFSDINTALTINPTRSFGFMVDTNYNQPETRFTGWSLTTKLEDDRGDNLSLSHSFNGPPIGQRDNNPQLDQTEGGLEAVLTDRVKFGMYTRYDNVEKEPITNRMAVRLYSSCNCWHMDVGYTDKINPDKQLVYMNFTFTGLGDISQELFSWGQTGP